MSVEDKPGFQATLEMFRGLTTEHQNRLLKDVAMKDPELAEKLLQNLVQFEDLKHVPVKTIQVLFKELPEAKWTLALRNASPDLLRAILKSMSDRVAKAFQESIQLLGPQPLSRVQEAQREIMTTALELESEGKIVLRVREDDPLV